MTTKHPLKPTLPPTAATGIEGLDAILHGGLPREEMHLVQGVAGTGKTTIALQFLREGAKAGESTLYMTLSQPRRHLERIARSHGWEIDNITIHELAPATLAERIAARQTILPTVEVELAELFRDLQERVTQLKPTRAVIDSITILQILAGTAHRYHREVVALRQLFMENGCTLLALADHPAEGVEGQSAEVIFHPLCGCVIQLEQQPRAYGDVRRHLRVVKARGLPNDGGYHDLKIRTGHMDVYPRLGSYGLDEDREYEPVASGVVGLDALLCGGLNMGTSCLLVGPSGTGKSTIATLYAVTAARAGERAAIFLFDERPETYLLRSDMFGIGLREQVEAERILLRQVDPGEISPGEFAQQVRRQVLACGTKLVVMDSIIGYFAAMGSADVLVSQLHELMTFLTRSGVLLLLCGAQESFMSIGVQTAVDVSYLSDTILALTFFETEGVLRRAVAVTKKKQGPHLSTIHEMVLVAGKVEISEQPLRGLRNVMVQGPIGPDRTTKVP
jgi:circadian clock protein KaiC